MVKDIDKIIGKRTGWHEYAQDRQLIACGELSGSDNMIIVSDNRGKDQRPMRIKCAGTHGEYLSLEAFDSANICMKCADRQGIAPIWEANDEFSTNITICQSEERRFTGGRFSVPEGCPHAIEATKKNKHQYAAKTLYLSAGKLSQPQLQSWRLTYGEDKLTLSIMYRTHSADPKYHKEKHESFYRHITADLESGQTYVSNIHNENNTFVSLYSSDLPQIDNITYTGKTVLLFSSSAVDLGEDRELLVPLRRMYEELCKLIAERGYHVAPPIQDQLYTWHPLRSSSNRHPQETMRGVDLLQRIAQVNRFPSLGCYPISDRDLPLQVKRDINALPRDLMPKDIAENLGFEDRQICEMAALAPQRITIPMVLRTCGCEDSEALAAAMTDQAFDGFMAIFQYTNEAHSRKSFNLYDILSLSLPGMLDARGWLGLVQDVAKDNRVIRDRIRNSIAILESIRHLPLYDTDEYKQIASAYNADVTATDSSNVPVMLGDPEFDDTFRKANRQWHFRRMEGSSRVYEQYQVTSHKTSRTNVTDHGCFAISRTYALDRRVWNMASARDFGNLAILLNIEYENQSELLEPFGRTKEDEKKLERCRKRINKLEKKLTAYYDKMERALLSSDVEIVSYSKSFIVSLDYDTAQALFKWSERHDLPLAKNFVARQNRRGSGFSHAKQNLKRRIKRAKKM